MARKAFLGTMMCLLALISTNAFGYQATFDMSYIESMDLSGSDPDAVVINERAATYEEGRFCEGVVKYKNIQETDNTLPPYDETDEGWAYGYFAVEIGLDEDCTDADDNPRPALIFLHPYGERIGLNPGMVCGVRGRG